MKTEKDNKNIKEEDYSLIEKIGIVIFPFTFYKYDTDLKKNGYITKSRSKIICVLLGFLLYAIIILLSNIV